MLAYSKDVDYPVGHGSRAEERWMEDGWHSMEMKDEVEGWL